MVRLLLSIYNPFPKKWKARWNDGTEVLDLRSRFINKKRTRTELNRRKQNGEETTKCFKITTKSSLDFSGKSR